MSQSGYTVPATVTMSAAVRVRMTKGRVGNTALNANVTIGTVRDPALAAVLSAWSREPGLAGPLADSNAPYLVLDRETGRLLHASPTAGRLAAALAPGGETGPTMLAQLPVADRLDAPPRLARLRLDPRRIAPPTLCLLAGGRLSDGRSVVLLLPTGPVALPRLRATARAAMAPAEAKPIQPPTPLLVLQPGERLVWRTDADGRITQLTGAAAPLIGMAWQDLAEAGHLRDGDALLAALAGRGTFRALPVRLDFGAGPQAAEVSGTPLARSDQPFAGYGGFAVARSVALAEDRPAESPIPEVAPASQVFPADVHAAPEIERDAELPAPAQSDIPRLAPSPSEASAAKSPAVEKAESAPADPVAARESPGPDTGEPETAEPVAAEGRPLLQPGPPLALVAREADDTNLSVTEHDAFREIARALGARYAGDEPGTIVPSPAPAAAETAIMPFPTPRAAGPDEGMAGELLDALPVALLIHRGDTILAANRRLRDLVGLDDPAAVSAGGLDRLFQGVAPRRNAWEAEVPVLLTLADGGSRPVAVDAETVKWQGQDAICLILRPVPEEDPVRALAAERLAQSFREGHAAEARAALDALDEGVLTVDGAGRIVAMNRGAARIFAGEPRELVGAGMASLFDGASGDAARAVLFGPDAGPRGVAVQGNPYLLSVIRQGGDGKRVAVLRASAPSAPDTVFDRAGFLRRLAREIQGPMAGILEAAGTIRTERLGPLGTAGYRACADEIAASGNRVLGLVSDLHDLATIEAGRMTMAVRPLVLNDIVSDCVERLQAQAASGRIVLRTSFAPGLALLEADETSLSRAASTVIANAIRLTGAGGQVIVSTMEAEQGTLALRVRDTGAGMTDDEVASVLEPFREGAAPGGGRLGGDLGLPLTKALVEANRGHLRISSRKDEGTLVEILLPGRVAVVA